MERNLKGGGSEGLRDCAVYVGGWVGGYVCVCVRVWVGGAFACAYLWVGGACLYVRTCVGGWGVFLCMRTCVNSPRGEVCNTCLSATPVGKSTSRLSTSAFASVGSTRRPHRVKQLQSDQTCIQPGAVIHGKIAK